MQALSIIKITKNLRDQSPSPFSLLISLPLASVHRCDISKSTTMGLCKTISMNVKKTQPPTTTNTAYTET
eukprot:m.113604 g.113604  ORF g.113604 m.113604 type:complete len:70 (-) comp28283_c2_seq1:550-759(-)